MLHANCSACFAHLSDGKRALTHANEAVRLAPDVPKNHARKAAALALDGRHDKAAESYLEGARLAGLRGDETNASAMRELADKSRATVIEQKEAEAKKAEEAEAEARRRKEASDKKAAEEKAKAEEERRKAVGEAEGELREALSSRDLNLLRKAIATAKKVGGVDATAAKTLLNELEGKEKREKEAATHGRREERGDQIAD